MVARPKQKLIQTDEIGLEDIIRFLSLNIKFLGVTTIVLSALAIPLVLLKPKQYQKRLALSVQPIPIPLSVPPTAQPDSETQLFPHLFPPPSITQTGRFAATILQTPPSDQVTASSRYDDTVKQINLALKSTNPDALVTATAKIPNRIQSGFQENLEANLKIGLSRVQLELNRRQQVLAQLQQQIARATPASARLEALETERAEIVAEIVALEFDRDYLKQAQKNPAEFAAQVISVQILTESDVQQTRSPLALAVIAVIASFMVAVLAAIIRNQAAYWQNELSKQKISGKNNS